MEMERRNPFEIALWVLAVVLVVGSIVGLYLVTVQINEISSRPTRCDESGCDTQLIQYVYQIAYSAAPVLIGSGFACAAIALGVRAVDVNARRRTGDIERTDKVESEVPVEEPRQAQVQRLDPSLFMRPRE
jgi:uncharacterized membrane protein YjgN (DUF898 family)